MCIRDRAGACLAGGRDLEAAQGRGRRDPSAAPDAGRRAACCLLYTSDAADERSSVDLGGRRIIQKKTYRETDGMRLT